MECEAIGEAALMGTVDGNRSPEWESSKGRFVESEGCCMSPGMNALRSSSRSQRWLAL